MCFLSKHFSTQARNGEPMFFAFDYFLSVLSFVFCFVFFPRGVFLVFCFVFCFSVHIIHSSVNFASFVFLSILVVSWLKR